MTNFYYPGELSLADIGRPGPEDVEIGLRRLEASRGPETARVIRPAAATRGLPMTGAASRAVPCAASRSRTCCEASTEIVEQSTTIAGAAPAGDEPGRAEHRIQQVLRRAHGGEHDVAVGELRG